MYKLTLLVIFTLCFCVNEVYGDIKLYLKPYIAPQNNNIKLRDIALVEGNYSDIGKISEIIIEKGTYNDGYIDKKEILSLVNGYTKENIFIYGNAVRIANGESENNYLSQPVDFVIKKGESVNVIVTLKGVSIILRGTVLDEGRLDDIVYVRLENKVSQSKLIKAKIKRKDRVEVNL